MHQRLIIKKGNRKHSSNLVRIADQFTTVILQQSRQQITRKMKMFSESMTQNHIIKQSLIHRAIYKSHHQGENYNSKYNAQNKWSDNHLNNKSEMSLCSAVF